MAVEREFVRSRQQRLINTARARRLCKRRARWRLRLTTACACRAVVHHLIRRVRRPAWDSAWTRSTGRV